MDMCFQCNIVYDARNCPLCEAKEKIEELEKQLAESKDKIEYLEDEIEYLKRGGVNEQ